MIANLGLLFLFGMTISFGQFMPKHNQLPFDIAIIPRGQPKGCPSGPELAPLICKFTQQNIDLQYKPKLISPTTYIPPLVLEKCDSPKLETEIDLPGFIDEKKAVVIPTPPELPPIMIPKFPVPVIIEEPPALVDEPYRTDDIAESPVVNIPLAPELSPFAMPVLPQITEQPKPQIQENLNPEIDFNVFEYEPMVVPQPPKLPAFPMAKFPMMPIVVAPCPEDESFAEIPMPDLIQSLAPVPAAPELPTVQLPEFPVRVEIPVETVLPPLDIFSSPMFIEQPIEEPRLNEVVIPEIDHNPVEFRPISIPQPPKLPAFVMPEFPKMLMEQELPKIATPFLEDLPAPVITVPEYIKPMSAVPAAPKLQTFVMPEFPVRVVEQELPAIPAPCPEDESFAEIPVPELIQSLAPVPAAPELPPKQLPEFPVRVEIPAEPVLPPVTIFSVPMFIEQPIEEPRLNGVVTPEVDHNLVEFTSNSVPQPPQLPLFVIPELPKIVVEQKPPIIAAPYPEDQPAPLVTISEYIQPLAPVPAAPELSTASLPEFSIRVEIPSGPLLMPNTEEPFLTEVPQPKPLIIPQLPKLPKLIMPELSKLELVALPMPAFAADPCDSSGQPTLKDTADPSPYFERYFPSSMEKLHKIVIPSQPTDPDFFPTRCVHNLVMEHVIPNIASDRFRSMDSVKVLPCS